MIVGFAKRSCATALVLWLSVGFVGSALALTWESGEIGVPTGNAISFPTMAEGASGKIYVAWRDGISGSVHLDTWNPGSNRWDAVSSFAPGNVTAGCTRFSDNLSMAVDDQDTVHLVFRGENGTTLGSSRRIYYATYNGTFWVFDQVTAYSDGTGRNNPDSPSLALGPDGKPHVAYSLHNANTSTSYIQYAMFGSSWVLTQVWSVTGNGQELMSPSLAVGSDSKPHVAFIHRDGNYRELKYAFPAAGPWDVTNVDTNLYLDSPSLALDGTNLANIAYFDWRYEDLRFAVQGSSNSWTLSTIDDVDDTYRGTVLSRNARGNMMVAYQNATDGDLKVAYKSLEQPWAVETVYTNNDSLRFIGGILTRGNKIMVSHDTSLADGTNSLVYSTAQAPSTNMPVSIQGNDPVSVSMDEDGSPTNFVLTLTADDADASVLTWTVTTPPSHGNVQGGAGFSFAPDYMPATNYNGPDTFTLQVEDDHTNSSTDTVTVNVTITPQPDPPSAGPDSYPADENSVLNVPADGVLGNDTDPDFSNGDTISVSAYDATSAVGATVSVGTNGSLTYDPTGSAVLQSLAVGDTNVDSFAYTVEDSTGLSATGAVSITVTGVNDPPVSSNDVGSVDEDNVLTTAPKVLDNDFDVDTGDTFNISASDTNSAAGAAVTVNPDGSYSYDPTAADALQGLSNGVTVVDTFTYTITDGHNASGTGTVSITVTGVNDAPVANSDTATAEERIILTVAAPGVLFNDTDPDIGDALSVISFHAASARGATVTVEADGGYTYDTSTAPTLIGLDPGAAVTDTFQYTVSDNDGSPATATVTITVSASKDINLLLGSFQVLLLAPLDHLTATNVPSGP
jgi:VCBS repeat-containing protein